MGFKKLIESANKITLEKLKIEVGELNLKYLRKPMEFCNDLVDTLEEEE